MAQTAAQEQLFDIRASDPVTDTSPVECLGIMFPSDTERRRYFREKLADVLRDGAIRSVPGFPNASDEAILELSDPPYYTACPNPFLAESVEYMATVDVSGAEPYERGPYLGELAVGDRHPVYSFHPYHTKVPPEVIRTLLEHYTDPGDLILDGFAGSGMTGVAAEDAGRNAVLVDLCPVATFIESVNCNQHDWDLSVELLESAISESEAILGDLYVTKENQAVVPVNYFVWSDVFACPRCGDDFPFFPHGVVHHGNKVETRKLFPCPSCSAELTVRRIQRVLTEAGKKKVLAWVNAGTGGKRISREPTAFDIQLASDAEERTPTSWYPRDAIDPNGYSAKLAQLGDKQITDVSRLLSRRNLIVFADLWSRVSGSATDPAIRNLCRATLTSIFTVISERQGYFGGGGGMSGNMYMPIVRMEKNIFDVLRRKLPRVEEAERHKLGMSTSSVISTQSTTDLSAIPEASIDYVYTDPPFGANIIYSEMNLALEAWLGVRTNDDSEAVIDATRDRQLADYEALMRLALGEYYRVLKPGRWMTLEFHNTQPDIWNVIQASLGETGFVIGQVGVLDKGSTTILGDIRPGSAKHDLIISAYKPPAALLKKFKLSAGSVDAIWDFVDSHLGKLPMPPIRDGAVVSIPEREKNHLYNSAIRFLLQRKVGVNFSAPEFYRGLSERYVEDDGMYFLAEQETQYRGAKEASQGVTLPHAEALASEQA